METDPYVNLPRILKTGECLGPACEYYATVGVIDQDRFGHTIARSPIYLCNFHHQRMGIMAKCARDDRHTEFVEQKRQKKVDHTRGTQLQDFGVEL